MRSRVLFIIIIGICGILILNQFCFQKTKKDVIISCEYKDEVKVFIRDYIFSNISDDVLDEKYRSFKDEDYIYFKNLKKGSELLLKEKKKKAWAKWDECLTSDEFEKYKAETYYVFGISIGESDGYTSYILLQKALEISRLPGHISKKLEYSCLNALVFLLVSQAEDEEFLQKSDVLAKQYSLEAHTLLNSSGCEFGERFVSKSVYRLAAESLLWLGEDSLANQYIEYMLEQNQFYAFPKRAEGYADMLKGVKSYIDCDFDKSEVYLKSAVNKIGSTTSFLNYDLELPYAYLGAVYIKKQCYSKAIDYMERSVKSLLNNQYNDISEALKLASINEFKDVNSFYNVILCCLRLQYFYKEALKNNVGSITVDKVIELSSYTNQLIKQWFLNAADEKTLLRATKLIKKSNYNVIDIIWEHQNQFSNKVERIYKLQTEASSFYLNYLIQLRKRKEEGKRFERIRNLTIELADVQKDMSQLLDDNINKRLSLLKYKSELWDENNNDLKRLVFNEIMPEVIPAHKALIKYFWSYSNLYITYFTPKDCGTKKIKCSKIGQSVKKFKRAIKSNADSDTELKFLYNLLIEPIEKELEGIDGLTILLDEKLEGITFELLKNKKGEYLIDHFAIQYAYSAKGMICTDEPEFRSFMALAPGFETNNSFLASNVTRSIIKKSSFVENSSSIQSCLKPIPFSEDEVMEIANLFDTNDIQRTVYRSRDATKTNFIEHVQDESVIHIATHGVCADHYNSGLFFSLNDDDNGFLSLHELFQINMNADLVVLSACKTGTGQVLEGEGIMALPRGFIYAGASNVVASLWKVHDEKTKELMVSFYKHIIVDKKSYAEALRLAKLYCKKKGFLPIDWAGFILIGK